MKAIYIDHEYYQFPDGIQSIEQFAKFLNENYNSFIKLTQYSDENCREPYFIEEETLEKYLNVSDINFFHEKEITLLSKTEYDERLTKIVKEKCVNCENYIEDGAELDLKGHRNKISLDGECFFYSKIEK